MSNMCNRDGIPLEVLPQWHSSGVLINLGNRAIHLHVEEAKKFDGMLQEAITQIENYLDRKGAIADDTHRPR
jgi:hypothetical protein